MNEKLFDLNSRREQNAALIRIADKEFKITRVVIAARVLYSNYLSEVSSFFKDVENVNNQEMNAAELERKYSNFSSSVPSRLSEIVKIILSSNGYDYDAAWWDYNADTADLRDFIDCCMTKDNSAGKGSKKK